MRNFTRPFTVYFATATVAALAGAGAAFARTAGISLDQITDTIEEVDTGIDIGGKDLLRT